MLMPWNILYFNIKQKYTLLIDDPFETFHINDPLRDSLDNLTQKTVEISFLFEKFQGVF